jgi:hypothetical protein
MSELEPTHRPGPYDDELYATPGRQATIELLGEDVVMALESQRDTLARIDGLTRVENPFRIIRPHKMDLPFLEPGEVEKVAGHRAKGWSREDVAAMSAFRSSKLISKLEISGGEEHKELASRSKQASSRLDQTDEAIDAAFDDQPDRNSEPDFDKIQAFIDSLVETAEILPSPTSIDVLKNMHTATAGLLRHRYEGLKRPISRKFSQRITTAALEEIGGLSTSVENLGNHVHKARNHGTACHEKITSIARNEQARTALRLLETMGDAKRLIPPLGDLTQGQVAIAIDTESYLASQVGAVEATLRSSAPAFLHRPEVQSTIRRLRSPDTARAMEAKQSHQENGQAKELSVHVSEARDVLRGGQRLEPAKRKPGNGNVDQVRQKANALYHLRDGRDRRLLEPEESGVIIAIVTGRFGNFTGVIDRVNAGNGDEALEIIKRERPEAIKALQEFNLMDASAKINDLLRDPDLGPKFIGILSADEIAKIEKTLGGILDTASSE